MCLITEDESIHIALDSDSDSREDSIPPLPKSRGTIVKSKKGTHSQRNLRSGMLINAHTCSNTGESVHIALGSNSHLRQECDPPLPMSRRAILKTKKGTASSKRSPRGNTYDIC